MYASFEDDSINEKNNPDFSPGYISQILSRSANWRTDHADDWADGDTYGEESQG